MWNRPPPESKDRQRTSCHVMNIICIYVVGVVMNCLSMLSLNYIYLLPHVYHQSVPRECCVCVPLLSVSSLLT